MHSGLDVRIARFHNIFGKWGTWQGGKEKAPAALIRKCCLANNEGEIEVWGTGEQSRSFMHISECLIGIEKLMQSDYKKPLNIGSDELVTINQLAEMCIDISGKKLSVKNIEGIVGVQGRNSDNTLIEKVLGWRQTKSLYDGLCETYEWINNEVHGNI
jgi:nucleoside-diphosphate-sugar epimerase